MPKIRRSKMLIAPFIAGLIIVMLSMQMLSYLSSAKNAQKDILGAATMAYSDLSDAGSSLAAKNFSDAQIKFTEALSNLNTAQNRLDEFKALQLVASQAKTAGQILSGASHLAAAGQKLTEALSVFDDLKVSSSGIETANLPDRLKRNQNSLHTALDELKQSEQEFSGVAGLPAEYASSFLKAKQQVSALSGMVQNLSNLEDIYLGFFGTGPRVYLLIFQNYDEVRATGGFIGTYGVLKINDGKIQDLKIESIYDLDGHIYDNVAAPGPFQPFIKKWGIRDANWFADFPSSARKLLQFFESGSQTADGVIAFTPAIFQDILRITGPIPMPGYDVVLSADNFQDVVQYKTSVDYDKQKNQPKQLLADFAPLLLNKFMSLTQEQWLKILQSMQENLGAKHILLFSKDPKLEKNIDDLHVSGKILASEEDYLNIINTNLGGTKSDLSIKQKAHLQSKILSDGSIIDTLTIERFNSGAVDNLDFMRVMVPAGSTLVSALGFDEHEFNPSQAEGYTTDPDLGNWDQGHEVGNTFIRAEAGKTEFTGWLALGAGETRSLRLTYVIPYKAKTNVVATQTKYSLLFQKQSGVYPYDFSATLESGNLTPYWHSADVGLDNGVSNLSYTTGSDQYWAILLNR
ncbi:MAG: DUF4012 domain-containing protein [Candidatus Doudnabacteria bacterium]|nr:DUF4012 domain-containing protein [Candidatus Doudnabacteria bacterium]